MLVLVSLRVAAIFFKSVTVFRGDIVVLSLSDCGHYLFVCDTVYVCVCVLNFIKQTLLNHRIPPHVPALIMWI